MVPLSPSHQHSLRAFSSNLETILEQCLSNYNQSFCEPKIELAVRAGHLYSRFLELHQLSAALCPILSDPTQVRSMCVAWDNVDVTNIADQCALSCNCEPEVSADIMNAFKGWLLQVDSMPGRGIVGLEMLGKWAEQRLEMVKMGDVPARS